MESIEQQYELDLVHIVSPKVEILTSLEDVKQFPKRIEEAGRVCYRSEDRAGADTAEAFCRMLISRGHLSVLEHCLISVRIICDRATSHQIVRHRLCSFSMESQRFVAYKNYLEVIVPPFKNPESLTHWKLLNEVIYRAYKTLLKNGEKPEDARSLLPNCTATRLVVSANVRQWRHVFEERAINKRAQGQIRSLMLNLLEKLSIAVPCLFSDLLLPAK